MVARDPWTFVHGVAMGRAPDHPRAPLGYLKWLRDRYELGSEHAEEGGTQAEGDRA